MINLLNFAIMLCATIHEFTTAQIDLGRPEDWVYDPNDLNTLFFNERQKEWFGYCWDFCNGAYGHGSDENLVLVSDMIHASSAEEAHQIYLKS